MSCRDLLLARAGEKEKTFALLDRYLKFDNLLDLALLVVLLAIRAKDANDLLDLAALEALLEGREIEDVIEKSTLGVRPHRCWNI